ncbi:MAG: hypothetical protein WAX04_03755 [Oscillospiraceae bacterium]
MNTIIIYGNKKDDQLKNILLKLLADKFKINYISDTTVSSSSGNKVLNIIETSFLNEIKVKNAILILKNNAKINAIKFIDKSTNIIINENNTKNLLCLAKSINNVFTCGFSSKDYITFSSHEDDNAIVSLQRSIKLLNGHICEPMEIPCKAVANINDYSILAATLTLILLGVIDENKVNF